MRYSLAMSYVWAFIAFLLLDAALFCSVASDRTVAGFCLLLGICACVISMCERKVADSYIR